MTEPKAIKWPGRHVLTETTTTEWPRSGAVTDVALEFIGTHQTTAEGAMPEAGPNRKQRRAASAKMRKNQ